MEQFKRAKIILIDNKQKGYKPYFFQKYNGKQLIGEYKEGPNDKYHLYIISDDEIKEGDWYYDNVVLQIRQWKSFMIYNKLQHKKIIATTDTSLAQSKQIIGKDNIGNLYNPIFLPQPSQQFIEKYIEEYNKGCVIKDVLVEYEGIISSTTWEHDEPEEWRLKINPKDNTITIKKIKDSWNKEEVIELIKRFNSESAGNVWFDTDEKWIEENL